MTNLLRRPQVELVTGLKKSSLYELVSKKEFPAPVKLSERSVAWVESEVSDWIEKRIQTSRNPGKDGQK